MEMPCRRSLYLCYLSLEDPLVQNQVVAYLAGLAAAGHLIHLITFEPKRLTAERRRAYREMLAKQGIRWHWLRYHKRPSLPATAFDTAIGAGYAAALVLRCQLDTLHARGHVPAAMAMIARRLVARRAPAIVFDIRGLMAEEYEDAGRWRRSGIAFRLTKAVERKAIAESAGNVVLTERVRDHLFGVMAAAPTFVIPCCADLEALAAPREERQCMRAVLGVDDATVMVYLGKFGSWYMAAEMARFFAMARQVIPKLRFLILSQSESQVIESELDRHGIREAATIAFAPASELARYLSAADFGICFIRPSPSSVSRSSTKLGEYLAAGLPVLCTAGVGDVDRLISDEVGVLIGEHTDESYRTAAETIWRLSLDRRTKTRTRDLARERLSLRDIGIPRYLALYGALENASSCAERSQL